MEVCFTCGAKFIAPESAESHWALTGHVIGDELAARRWTRCMAADVPAVTLLGARSRIAPAHEYASVA